MCFVSMSSDHDDVNCDSSYYRRRAASCYPQSVDSNTYVARFLCNVITRFVFKQKKILVDQDWSLLQREMDLPIVEKLLLD